MNAMPMILLAEGGFNLFSGNSQSSANSAHSDVLIDLLALAAIGAIVWLVVWLLFIRGHGQAYDSPWRLFRALCKAHRLKWAECYLLRRMAKLQGLKDPARIFLEIDRWELRRIPEELRHRHNQLNVLRRRLFENPDAQTPLGAASTEKIIIPFDRAKQLNEQKQTSDPKPPTEQKSTAEARPTVDPTQPAETLLRSETQAARSPVAVPIGAVMSASPVMASPLLPPMPSPTLDLPPWTAAE